MKTACICVVTSFKSTIMKILKICNWYFSWEVLPLLNLSVRDLLHHPWQQWQHSFDIHSSTRLEPHPKNIHLSMKELIWHSFCFLSSPHSRDVKETDCSIFIGGHITIFTSLGLKGWFWTFFWLYFNSSSLALLINSYGLYGASNGDFPWTNL